MLKSHNFKLLFAAVFAFPQVRLTTVFDIFFLSVLIFPLFDRLVLTKGYHLKRPHLNLLTVAKLPY